VAPHGSAHLEAAAEQAAESRAAAAAQHEALVGS
jgi:hypothetical protein